MSNFLRRLDFPFGPERIRLNGEVDSGAAQLIGEARAEAPAPKVKEEELAPGARGTAQYPVRIHSVRLPGLVAHQEVILGGTGQTLTVRHDSISRESFMPGVLLAVKKVMTLERLYYGLEHLL